MLHWSIVRFYANGEPCDIPEGCRLVVRVQMPEGSVWNCAQGKMISNSTRNFRRVEIIQIALG
ncbi:hypothetical protein FE392_10280 [Xenorhabdus sp. 12]|uniref:Uncharacterized protein n=1 Tax=Xenorhabdus santafensis TaxID=2582833 RepID=A0ABU4SAB5_9GAMM|nr:hypothetical protein [Xenorhabdus sp. 12]